jgi:hypothetical protein
MTSPTPVNGRAVNLDGRDRADPAHDGPLPQATLPELVGRLINDVSDLADRQVELAKQEIGEAKDEAISAVKRVAIGAGIGLGAGLLLIIWLWTAVIWFFNWVGAHIVFPTPIGTQSLAWIGWLIGLIVPAVLGFLAYRFIRKGISEGMAIWPPLPRTRQTLKEDLEWLQRLRTPNAR